MIAPIDFDALTLDQARELWLKHLKLALPRHRSRDLLVRALSYHLQARANGGLTQTLRRKLDDLAPRFATDRDFAPAPAERPKPGSVLVREWNSVRHAVTVTDLAQRFATDRDFTPAPAERPKPGSVLIREWNGVRHAVTVTDTGFLYNSKPFASLTAVARAITGTHWNGPHFFRLNNGERKK